MSQLEFLTHEQRESLAMFKEITNLDDNSTAIDILTRNNWNVDQSVERFLIGNTNSGSDQTSTASEQEGPITQPPSSSLDLLLNPLRWLFQTHPIAQNPDSDTRKFIHEFDQKYSPQHPVFFDRSFQSAVAEAHRNSKFLLAYLHSPIHEDAERFCNQTICSLNFAEFVNENFIMWAGKIWDPEAFLLSEQSGISAYPCVVMFLCPSERTVQPIDKIQGFSTNASLIARLRGDIAAHTPSLLRQQQEVGRRSEYSTLREEQDREYRESEEADRRERERAQQLERERERVRREEEERKLREEEEEQQRLQEEEAKALSLQLSHEAEIERMKQRLQQEPAGGAGVATIRFQLPQGKKVARRFLADETVQSLYDYLSIHFHSSQLPTKRFSLSTQFPKIELNEMNQTLQELGLVPRAMLYVQDLDS